MSTPDPPAQELLDRIAAGQSLSRAEARCLFNGIMRGAVPTAALCGLLTDLAARGETLDEIVGAAEAMRAHVQPVRVPAGVEAIDTCGTGGDGKRTFNVSSAVAIVAAAAGATVAKHGNRSHARPSGSAEGLTALGINVDAPIECLERCLRECRVAFLYAPRLHPAMRHAAEARARLGIRTIFNRVGPLTNPAWVRRQLVGVGRVQWLEPTVEALHTLGSTRALVVHGLCGLCDLSIDGPTRVAQLHDGRFELRDVNCTDFGVAEGDIRSVFVESPVQSASMIESVLQSHPGPALEMVVLNAGAALWVAGIAEDIRRGVDRARAAIEKGAALATLERWRTCSHDGSTEAPPPPPAA